jgi:hypothetical protein
LTDVDGQALVKGTLALLAPSRFKGYKLAQHLNTEGWEDFEIRARLVGISTTNSRSNVNIYLDDSTINIAPGKVTLTGNETLLGSVVMDGNAAFEKVFTLSALQRFSRGFPPSAFNVVVANITESPLNELGNVVSIRGMRHEEVTA